MFSRRIKVYDQDDLSLIFFTHIQVFFGRPKLLVDNGFGRLEVRLLQNRDYSSVRELYKAVRNEYVEYQIQTSGRVYDPVRLDLDASQLDFYVATHCSFAAINNGRLLGVLLAQPLKWINDQNKVLWLEYIAVHAAHRRRGIGLSLISAAKNLAQEHDIKGLFTTLNIDNQESKSLLVKAGFNVKDWRIASYPPDNLPEAISDKAQ